MVPKVGILNPEIKHIAFINLLKLWVPPCLVFFLTSSQINSNSNWEWHIKLCTYFTHTSYRIRIWLPVKLEHAAIVLKYADIVFFCFSTDIHRRHHQPADRLLRGPSPGARLCFGAAVRQNDGAVREQGPGGGDVPGPPRPRVWSTDLLQLPERHLLRVCQRDGAGWWAAAATLHLQVCARTALTFSFIVLWRWFDQRRCAGRLCVL